MTFEVGAIVYDREKDMVAEVVKKIDSVNVMLQRPYGKPWKAPKARLRPATPYEKRQLNKLGPFREAQRRGNFPLQ
ncbi:hypothetical protein [Streptomyces sp. 4F14]|uniref:hypothetical protein n=1 Tax=Streptomyces sp. 4F14 TaxID=3394380 RepID=UPI003A8AE44C